MSLLNLAASNLGTLGRTSSTRYAVTSFSAIGVLLTFIELSVLPAPRSTEAAPVIRVGALEQTAERPTATPVAASEKPRQGASATLLDDIKTAARSPAETPATLSSQELVRLHEQAQALPPAIEALEKQLDLLRKQRDVLKQQQPLFGSIAMLGWREGLSGPEVERLRNDLAEAWKGTTAIPDGVSEFASSTVTTAAVVTHIIEQRVTVQDVEDIKALVEQLAKKRAVVATGAKHINRLIEILKTKVDRMHADMVLRELSDATSDTPPLPPALRALEESQAAERRERADRQAAIDRELKDDQAAGRASNRAARERGEAHLKTLDATTASLNALFMRIETLKEDLERAHSTGANDAQSVNAMAILNIRVMCQERSAQVGERVLSVSKIRQAVERLRDDPDDNQGFRTVIPEDFAKWSEEVNTYASATGAWSDAMRALSDRVAAAKRGTVLKTYVDGLNAAAPQSQRPAIKDAAVWGRLETCFWPLFYLGNNPLGGNAPKLPTTSLSELRSQGALNDNADGRKTLMNILRERGPRGYSLPTEDALAAAQRDLIAHAEALAAFGLLGR